MAIGTQEPIAVVEHRSHWYAKVIGKEPLQDPSVAVRARPTRTGSKLSEGGEISQCGWLKDKFGLSWQIIPSALPKLLGDPDREKANRVMLAMLQMQKIEVAKLQQAYQG